MMAGADKNEVIRLSGIGKSYYIGKEEVPVLTQRRGICIHYGALRCRQIHSHEYPWLP